MCGIVGYIGNGNQEKILLDMLKHLEYRGYDSAGIAVINDEDETSSQNEKNDSQSNKKNLCKIEVTKTKGKLSSLEQLLKNSNKIPKNKYLLDTDELDSEELQNKLKSLTEEAQEDNFENSTCGIGHTRWATHGEATTQNAHPHLSNNNEWSIVHNGIIENFQELKDELVKNKFTFKSKTDSEIIANLLQHISSNSELDIKSNPILPLIETCKKLKGSYALVCINKNFKNTLFLAKKKSPLYVAKSKKNIVVASDPICFAGKTREYYCLEDDEFCLCTNGKIEFFNKNIETLSKEPTKLENLNNIKNKTNYKHFMQKEINEIPEVLKNIAKRYSNTSLLETFDKTFLKKFNKLVLIGCGTAYHASLIGARYIQDFARIDAQTCVASEFRYKNPIIDAKTLVILVSQSGETADTIAVCEEAKSKGCTTIALTNVEYSTLSKLAHYTLPLCAGTEIAVASTKAYVAQVAVLYMLAKQMQNALLNKTINYIENIENLSNEIIIPSKQEFTTLVDELAKKTSAFFIGRDYDYITCEEASLKLKEITYINSNAYPAGELKHGFLALIDDSSYLFVIATKKALLEKTLNGAYEAKSRGANLIFASQFELDNEVKKDFKYVLPLPNVNEELMPICAIITFQVISYLTCLKRKLNPDKPRNLAKSVTVE